MNDVALYFTVKAVLMIGFAVISFANVPPLLVFVGICAVAPLAALPIKTQPESDT